MSQSANQDYLSMHKLITEQFLKQSEQVDVTGLVLEEEALRGNIRQSVPLTSVIKLPITKEQFLLFIEEIATILQDHQPAMKGTIEAILTNLQKTDIMPIIEATNIMDWDYLKEYADKHQLNAAILQFLVEMAYRPYVKALSKSVNENVTYDGYHNKNCPVCGETARIMREADGGKREACCTRCETVWELLRLQCPLCKSEDHEKLQYIKAGTEESRKIYACDTCKGYVKYIDMKEMLDKPSFFLIDLETIYLDMIAAQQGYGVIEKK